MTQYKILAKSLFKKDKDFEETLNTEARNGWKVLSVGYSEGQISRVVLEKSNN